MKRLFEILLVGSILCFRVAEAQETPMTYTDGSITSKAVLPPLGTFLLIRKNDALCAVQFTGAWRSNDTGESTAFHSGDESFRARYAWYLGKKISGTWVIHPPKASGQSELTQGRLVGVGRLAFNKGNIRIRCGPIVVKWTAPAHVYFYHGEAGDQGNEIAVTPWTRFEDVDPNDRSLQWLRYEKNRPKTVIAPTH